MRKSKFLSHATNIEGLDDEEAHLKWKEEIAKAQKEDLDQGGLLKEPLRLHYLCEDFTVGECELAHQKRVDMSIKGTKAN